MRHFFVFLIGVALFVSALLIGALADGLTDGQQGCLWVLGIGGIIIGLTGLEEM